MDSYSELKSTNSELSEFLESVKELIRAKGLSHGELALQLGVTRSTLQRWLRGDNLSLNQIFIIIKTLGFSLQEVTGKMHSQHRGWFEFTEQEEETLAQTPGLLAFINEMAKGKSIERIKVENYLTKRCIEYYLGQVNQIGLVDWDPVRGARLAVNGEPRLRKGGVLEKMLKASVLAAQNSGSAMNSTVSSVGVYMLTCKELEEITGRLKATCDFAKSADKKNRSLNGAARNCTVFIECSEALPTWFTEIPQYKQSAQVSLS